MTTLSKCLLLAVAWLLCIVTCSPCSIAHSETGYFSGRLEASTGELQQAADMLGMPAG